MSDDWRTRAERDEDNEASNKESEEQAVRDYDAAVLSWEHSGRQGPMPTRPKFHPDEKDVY